MGILYANLRMIFSSSLCSSVNLKGTLNVKNSQRYKLCSTSFILTTLFLSLCYSSAKGGTDIIGNVHKCYVCLPPDKSSAEALEILGLFKDAPNIPPCATNNNFTLNCPPGHLGCTTRAKGSIISRSCVRFSLDDCKIANGVEICYCSGSLCNGGDPSPIKPSVPSSSSALSSSDEGLNSDLGEVSDSLEDKRGWRKLETDDEDLLMGDEGGSGHTEGPPGVIDLFPTTPKPTLKPNLRNGPQTKPTLPPPASTAPLLSSKSFNLIITCSSLFLYSRRYLVNQ